jgi:hypothetical protein
MGRTEAAQPLDAMRRAVLVGVLAGAAAAGAVLLGRSGGQAPLHATRPLTVQAVFAPQQTVQFGDPVTARVVVLLDRAAVRAGSLRIADSVAPLTQLGAPRTTRTRRGGLDVVSVTVPAACLADACTTAVSETPIALPPVTVAATTTAGRALRATGHWPVLHVRSRLAATDIAASTPPFRDDTSPSPPSYRIAPDTLALVLTVLAALLAAAGVALAAWQGLALAARRRPPAAADELEVALRRTREAQSRPAPERRRAVGRLARVLEERGPRLAGAADRLAWSEPTPEPDALSALVTEVERTAVP